MTGSGSDESDQQCFRPGLAKTGEFFSKIVKAGERTCWCAAGEMSKAFSPRRPVDRCEAVRPWEEPVSCGEAWERGSIRRLSRKKRHQLPAFWQVLAVSMP